MLWLVFALLAPLLHPAVQPSGPGASQALASRLTVSVDQPAYTGEPLWVRATASPFENIRYPFHAGLEDMGCNRLEVKRDGVLLIPRPLHSNFNGSGIACGSAAPQGAPQNRLPIHITSELLEQLPSLDRALLLDLWHRSFDCPASPGLRRELMLPILAFRIQELDHGGLKPETKAKLREITASLSPKGHNDSRPKFKAGTRLVREWKGIQLDGPKCSDVFGRRARCFRLSNGTEGQGGRGGLIEVLPVVVLCDQRCLIAREIEWQLSGWLVFAENNIGKSLVTGTKRR